MEYVSSFRRLHRLQIGLSPLQLGRQIDEDEALAIIRLAEESGLVHMVDNSQEGIKHTCNCCEHAC